MNSSQLPKNTDLILLDTCVLMADPDIVLRVEQKGGLVFLTNTVLEELDYNKNGDDEWNKNARQVLKELNKNGISASKNAAGLDIAGGDLVSQSSYKGAPIRIIHRKQFRSKSNNDSRILEIADDYSMILISADQGLVVRAKASGVESHYWSGKDIKQFSATRTNTLKGKSTSPLPKTSQIKPFRTFAKPIATKPEVLSITSLPIVGDSVWSSRGKPVLLKSALGKGGEGQTYLTDNDQVVCKIYKQDKLTNLKRDKIMLMLTRQIREKGIAWPTDYVVNPSKEFVGYLMPRAAGVPLQPTIFVKPHFEKCLPQWTRRDLAVVSERFLHQVRTLHDANILVGDINPLNVLVNRNSDDVWLVDTDSFQIENYPCPVGTINFTAPEIQGKNYATFLRSKDVQVQYLPDTRGLRCLIKQPVSLPVFPPLARRVEASFVRAPRAAPERAFGL